MEETQMPDEEQLQKIMEQLQDQFDPKKFMTPSQREIAELSDEELSVEYLLVQSKTSNRSRMQRDFIVTRYEFDLQQKQIEVDNLNQETND
tara:strand:+ start:360 stop:632 length:273 start_codon:yes stop_codon:yes gene_type:complete